LLPCNANSKDIPTSNEAGFSPGAVAELEALAGTEKYVYQRLSYLKFAL
jgi:hypothetical protein